MTDKIVVLVTCSSVEEGRKIARALVERRLAACVNVVTGIESVYRWKGAVEEASECLLLAKTTRGRFDPLQSAVRELHSYELPEVVALPIVDGVEAYLSWIETSVA
ncbi:MAG: divalent-cation tolerance protein CutA [Bryobacteraceae bacterium]